MGVRTLVDYTEYHDGHVEDVTIRETDDPTYPSGWRYSLHYGTTEGATLLRYDNSHAGTKGHERHTPEETAEIEFPGMRELYRRFEREVESLPP
jgi:hypothetical protein